MSRRNRRYEVGVGALLAGAFVVAGWMSTQVGAVTFAPRVAIVATFQDAAGLVPGASVKVAGVEVGTVEGLRVEHDLAYVALSVDPAAEIRRDARAQVRARSILGEKYVEILPVSRDAPIVQEGDTLQAVGVQTEIDEMVNEIGPLLKALDAEKVDQILAPIAAALQRDPERVERMVANLDRLLADGASTAEQLPELVGKADRTLDSAGGALRDLRALAEQGDGLVGEARTAIASARSSVERLERAAEPAPELIAETRAAVEELRRVLAVLDTHRDDVGRILDNLAGIDEETLKQWLQEDGVRIRLNAVPEKR